MYLSIHDIEINSYVESNLVFEFVDRLSLILTYNNSNRSDQTYKLRSPIDD